MPNKLYAQGDIVLELVEDANPGNVLPNDADGAVVLACGELTGHRHAFYGGGVTLFHDDALAREVPLALYIGHVKVRHRQPTCSTKSMRPFGLRPAPIVSAGSGSGM
jgi:hypothetical protein